MSTTIHIATASVVKVTVGPASGTRVGRIIHRDSVVPEGVEPEQLKRLIERGLIKAVEVPTPEEIAEATAAAAANAEAERERQATAAAERAAKAAETKATADAKKAGTTPPVK